MKKEFNPRVSIIIPVYNGSNYLKEAIDSALSQTYKNIEIIVINDGSADGGKTDEICKSYGKKIRYFKKENGGVATALNMGIEKMEGEYFSWLSHDDVYYPDKVEKQIEILSKLEDKETVVYSGYEIIDSKGEFLVGVNFQQQYKKEDLDKSLFPFFHLILNGCAMLIHKKHFRRVGMFDINRPTTQDYDEWFRILRNAQIIYDDNVVLKSRSHSEQGSKALLEHHIEECDDFWLKVFSSITEGEKVYLEGSKLDFYRNMWKSFKTQTLYNKVISYLEGELLEQILCEYRKEPDIAEKNEIMQQLIRGIYNEDREFETIAKVLNYKEKKKNRILFFTGNWYDRGGINRVISIISSLLVDDYDVMVCCIKENGNENGYELDKRVGFIELEESDFMYIPQILKLLEVDVFVGSNNCFVPLLKLYEQIKNFNIKTIMWNHESYFEPFYDQNFRDSVVARVKVYEEVDVVLWLSNLSATIGKVLNNNILVMENPLSIKPPKEYVKSEKPLNIISVGRFNSPRKRMDRLIKVFAQVLKKRPGTKLYIVGPYDLSIRLCESETIAQLIERLDIPQNSIVFTGEVKEVEQYYTKASVHVMVSEREGFGLTVLEAAAFGLPSVIFNGGGSAEIIEDGLDGYVVEDDDLNQMGLKILSLLNNQDILERMAEAAFSMTRRYSQEAIGLRWKELIDRILNSNEKELRNFLEKEYVQSNKDSSKHLKNIVTLYEGALEKQEKEIIRKMENSWSLRITRPLRKMKRLVVLIKTQGLKITTQNIFLKMKKSIFKQEC